MKRIRDRSRLRSFLVRWASWRSCAAEKRDGARGTRYPATPPAAPRRACTLRTEPGRCRSGASRGLTDSHLENRIPYPVLFFSSLCRPKACDAVAGGKPAATGTAACKSASLQGTASVRYVSESRPKETRVTRHTYALFDRNRFLAEELRFMLRRFLVENAACTRICVRVCAGAVVCTRAHGAGNVQDDRSQGRGLGAPQTGGGAMRATA